MPHLTPGQWLLAIVAAMCIGISKSGFAGLSLVTVVLLARLFPPRESTGILLPLLICGDLFAVLAFRRHAQWPQIWRMLPPTIAGVIGGWWLMGHIPDARFSPVIGWIVLVMTVLQLIRKLRPGLYGQVPHSRPFAYGIGTSAGVVTMLANAAGPVMALYFMAVNLPKLAFVGTSAWFFLIVNVIKVPFSLQLGLIHGSSLLFNAVLIPAVAVGILSGRWLITIIPQEAFDYLLLGFTALASLRLMGVF